MAKKNIETTSKLTFEDNSLVKTLLGEYDENLKFIEKALKVKINVRGNAISVHGETDNVQLTKKLMQELYFLIESNHSIYHNEIDYAIKILRDDETANLKNIFLDTIHVSPKQRLISPKSIVPLAYDSGGVTTSTVTVPLVAALGLGLSTTIPGRNPALDGFGLIAFASLFPMITVMGYAQIVQWWTARRSKSSKEG